MAEFMSGLKRTAYCTEITDKYLGEEVTITGWADSWRNHGGLIFVDLRDRSGIMQVVFDMSAIDEASFAKAESIRSEYAIAVKGILRNRDADRVNSKIKTGELEVLAGELRILSTAETPPFQLSDAALVNDALRLKYRYLELRTPKLQEILMLRDKVTNATRSFLSSQGFIDIETPILCRSTPEGARDYLVPSRVHKGEFYALPQSPQLYKQILMVSGMDKYYQIAKCFRDEDLRADRQPEFTQIVLEMSFIESQDTVMEVAEGTVRDVFKTAIGYDVPKEIKRMTYDEAMTRFGSDKPDTRFGLEIQDVTDLVSGCGFQVFSGAVDRGGSVRLINAKGFYKGGEDAILSRKDVDNLLPFVKTYRAKGLAWIGVKEDGLVSPIVKFLGEELTNQILERANAEVGDIIFFGADSNDIVFASLGALRLHLAKLGNLIEKGSYDFLWVTDFPMFAYNEEEKRYTAEHHPFTMPNIEDLELLKTDPLKVRAQAYDFVINGYEAGGGSVRIHSQEIQNQVFELLGFTPEEITERFGFFVDALKYGTPPHAGLAFGLDRLVMLLAQTDDIKDVMAFPKVQNASDLMSMSPSVVEVKQLNDLGIKIDELPKSN